jgi:hypothetical protein
MDAGTFQSAQVGLTLVGAVVGWGVWYRNELLKKGRHDQFVKTLETQRAEDAKKREAAETHQANQTLRIFRAIEEIRRKLGNGDRKWEDLYEREQKT